MQIQPYLFFEGRCEEALQFYRDRLGAQTLMMMRYRDSPDQQAPAWLPPGSEDKIMHASFQIDDSVLMAADGQCSGAADFKGFSLSLTTVRADEAHKHFDALSDGGQIVMPLTATFFSPAFGMVKDRFGLTWMVMCHQDGQG